MATKVKCILTATQLAMLSAAFGVSNMGQEVRLPDPSRWADNLTTATYMLAEPYMEEDEHEEIFLGETGMWHKQFERMTTQAELDELVRIHGGHHAWVATILEYKG